MPGRWPSGREAGVARRSPWSSSSPSCSARATLTVSRPGPTGPAPSALPFALDAEAVQAAEAGGTPLAQRVRLSDLSGRGLAVTPWTMAPDGSASIVVTKPFRTPAELGRHRRRAERPRRAAPRLRGVPRRGVARASRTPCTSTGTVDLRSPQPGVPADAALVRAPRRPAGQRRALEAAAVAGSLASSVSLRVVVDRPRRTASGDRPRRRAGPGGGPGDHRRRRPHRPRRRRPPAGPAGRAGVVAGPPRPHPPPPPGGRLDRGAGSGR